MLVPGISIANSKNVHIASYMASAEQGTMSHGVQWRERHM